MKHRKILLFFISSIILFSGCKNGKNKNQEASDDFKIEQNKPKEYVLVKHPVWTKNATIYEVNIRQYTPEGTFNAFIKHLPRLRDMGIDILWIMPIHPIGKEGRKGTLGSPYAVKDYYAVNPEFGDMQSFKNLVDSVHKMGMHIIIDWVANHSAKDNELLNEHHEWYIRDRNHQFTSTPWRDYDDIIDFDYSKPQLRTYMTDAMKFWLKETNIDGFRCDVASFVPIDFWETTRAALDSIKPVFMLAEAADRDLHQRAFDMTYSWTLWDALHNITTKNASIELLTGGYIAEHVSIWPRDGYRMNFIDNHDKNAWEGTAQSNFGKGLHAAMVLAATLDGMPMVYSGQEAGLNKALPFFEKDVIEWKEDTAAKIYSLLFNLKHENKALWNGNWGGEVVRIKNDKMKQVISFVREKKGDKVICIVNLSDQPAKTNFEFVRDRGNYTELFSGDKITLEGKDSFDLKPWSYMVLYGQYD
jgi:cyclomaltodextrinase